MNKTNSTPAEIPASFTGPVTRKQLRERAVELAVAHGGSAHDVSKSDWEQAKRELKVDPSADPKEDVLEAAPESERWDPVPGSTGHQTPESPSDDEDEEGRSETEQLVDDGVEAAERDQALQAARAAGKSDRHGP